MVYERFDPVRSVVKTPVCFCGLFSFESMLPFID